MGVGVHNTYHRRLHISGIDGLGMMTAKLGSGSNLLGYYMFAGGTNPRGILHGTEEEQEETGYWTRVSPKSYDFQAAIKESGELSESYCQVKKLHYFVNDFGEQLAPMLPVLGKSNENELQYAVRSDNRAAYLFGINYCRYVPKAIRKNVQFEIQLKDETVRLPQKGVTIPDSTFFIWPINLPVKSSLLKYATAQPLCQTDDMHVFYQNTNIEPEFAFDASTLTGVTVSKGRVETLNGRLLVHHLQAGKDCVIHLHLKDGSTHKILLLTEQQANDAWLLSCNGKKEFYLSKNGMYAGENRIYAYAPNTEIHTSRWSGDSFQEQVHRVPEKNEAIEIIPHTILSSAQWLESANFHDIPDYMVRYHRFFFKEFSLDNPSGFRKITFYIYPETACSLNLNNAWVRQDIRPGQLNAIDLTGYVQKGENQLFVDFPYTEGQKKFAARVVVEYRNYDRIEFSTDDSWLYTDMYTTPSLTKQYNRPTAPVIVTEPSYARQINYPGFGEWDMYIPYGALDEINALYIHLSYTGDRAELYNGYRLSADNFNNNLPWQTGLQRLHPEVEGKTLRLVVYPLSESAKIFFDVPPRSGSYETTSIDAFTIIPEYKICITQ
jgi:hypothetical protein